MRRLRELTDADDPAVAGLARLVRSVGELDPPHGAQDRVRDRLLGHVESDTRWPVIRHYRVTGMLGRGGTGTVYAAEHELLHRPVAIKLLAPALSHDQDVVLRLFNEARAATAIRHPGIVEIHDVGWTAEGEAFVVMERLDGETLAQRLARGRLPWRAALAVARQIAGALSAAHAAGIVHRDLKPDNMFLSPDPEVPGGERIKLLDFGIAKLSADDSRPSLHLTRPDAVVGTPAYMAPEQCRGVAVDHRADLYALGCVVFALCTGRPPFAGEVTGDVLAAQINQPPPTLASGGVEVPAGVERLIQQLLVKSPALRLQSAAELIRAIDGLSTDAANAARSPRQYARPSSATTLSGAAGSGPFHPTSRSRRGRMVAVFAAAALVALIAARIVIRESQDVGPPNGQPAAAMQPAVSPPLPTAANPLPQTPRAPEPPTPIANALGGDWQPVDAALAAAAGSSPGSTLITSARGGECPPGFACLYQNAQFSGVGFGISQGGSLDDLQGMACLGCKNGIHGNDQSFNGQMSSWDNNTDHRYCWYHGKRFGGRSVKMPPHVKHQKVAPDNNDTALSIGPC